MTYKNSYGEKGIRLIVSCHIANYVRFIPTISLTCTRLPHIKKVTSLRDGHLVEGANSKGHLSYKGIWGTLIGTKGT